MKTRYTVARFFLTVVTIAGLIAIAVGILAAMWGQANGQAITGYGIAAILALNGLLAIAGAQMGAATLDAAVATREIAESINRLVERDAEENPRRAEATGSGLRAIR